MLRFLAPAPLLFVGLLAGGCTKSAPSDAPRAPPSASSAPSAALLHRDPYRLARIDVDMNEDEVTALLGPPDDMAKPGTQHAWIEGAASLWAYGATAPGGFAFGGIVYFDAKRRVLSTRSPIDGLSVRVRRLPWSDTAVVYDRGLSCGLEILSAGAAGVMARVRLQNAGASVYERRHGHTGIVFDLVVELFDTERRLLARYDTLSYFSPFAPDDTQLMTIPPGGSISDTLRLDGPWNEMGKLPAGTYRVRVAFPFEMGHFSPSAPVTFQLGG